MEIAVISSYACIHTSNNYGALLQYYALQQYLKSRGHDVYWIRSIIPQSNLRIILRHIKNYRDLGLIRKYYRCRSSFRDFVEQHLNVTPKIYIGNIDLSNQVPEADFYITGSDQVWGGELKENYLLFVRESCKKIAYAASFGRDKISQAQIEVITPWIKDIPNVSVRESTGVGICKEMGVDAVHLLDPTLLIDAQLYPVTEGIRSDRIFVIFLMSHPNLN